MRKKSLALTLMLAFSWLLGGDLMGQKTLPYSYGFENNDLAGEGWTMDNCTPTSTAIQSSVYNSHNGSYYFRFYSDKNYENEYLISPLLNSAEALGVLVKLYFRAGITPSAPYTRIRIGYSTKSSNITDFTWTYNEIEVTSSTYSQLSITCPVNGIKYIAIQHIRNGSSANVYIDDIELSEAIYLPPQNITASAIVTSASISWEAGSNETSWLLYYSTSNSNPAENLVEPGTYVKAVSDNPRYTLTELENGTKYYTWVRSNYSNGHYSEWIGPVDFTPSSRKELTVNDGTETVYGAPVYGYYSNSSTSSQFIIPSTSLTDIAGKKVLKLTFYAKTANITWGTAVFSIRIKEVNYSTFTNTTYHDWNDMTEVYSGTLSTDPNKNMVIDIEDFDYNGGNLLIGFNMTTAGSNSSCNWNGIASGDNTNYPAIVQYGSNANSKLKNLPKITFLYDNYSKSFDSDGNWPTSDAPTATDNVLIQSEITVADGTNATANIIALDGSSTLTIADGATLTCDNIIGATQSNLTIADGGQLVCNNAVQATVQKNISAASNWGTGTTYTPNNWYFIASPVSTLTIVTGMYTTGDDGDYDLYRLNNTTWENYKNDEHDDFTTLNNGQGYLYASEEGTTIEFTGAIKPYDADYTISVTEGWNLVGNPYTFNAYVSTPYYAMNDGGTGITATTVSTSTAVKPCTGIIIKADAAGTVKFSNEAPASSTNNGNLQMVLAHNVATRDGASVNSTIDNAIVSFNEGTRLEKFYFGEQAANIFIPQNGEEYAIAFSDRQGEVPVCFKAKEVGTYTISFETQDFETNDRASLQGAYLIDVLEEEEIDLSVNPSYTFIGSPADRAERFVIRFKNAEQSENSVFAYQNGSDIVVTGEGELQIFDVMGRIVAKQYVSGMETINVNAHGVYIMKLNGMTQKIIIK